MAQKATVAGVFEPSTVSVGDSFSLRLVVSGTSARPDRVDYSAWKFFLPSENVLHTSPWEHSGDRWVSTIILIVFDSVNQDLPPLAVRLLSGDSAMTNPMHLVVVPPRIQGDISEMAAIRDLKQESMHWTDFVLIALSAFALGAVVLYWSRRRTLKKRMQQKPQYHIPDKPEVPEIIVPAHTRALQELARLSRDKPWQKGEIKAYYADLSLIMRNYLEERYQIDAPESTTREIEAMLRQTHFPKERMADLKKILEQSDLAKYAQDLGADKPHEQYILRSEELIKQTAADS